MKERSKKRKQLKHPRSFISKDKMLIKTVPLFFTGNTEETETINAGESVYTQLSREMLNDKNKIKYVKFSKLHGFVNFRFR